eukprot:CAMPEP_0197479864 /NCGR_PEP_ID=MMETSP1309-20131121/36968_1 /TAXON_ID=464262 /ORGANISM="Genus nov. species nov., Strain RCC998" /LENGTH=146 /DNA_ID=CAMNT_0043021645 /DNA_START=187 /DNA_END=627 /DNA_ORIENTATION=+
MTRTFDTLQNPAVYNVRYSGALEEFVLTSILAYECGCSMKVMSIEDNGCKEYVGLVWMTLERVPSAHGKRKRWSETDAVDHLFAERWKGFVQLICNAYFSKRMVWYPLDRLQLEMSISCGKSDPPELIAERARLIFTTLKTVAKLF